ncbi:MAG TPA: class E sortase [Trebonia sp.]
MTAGHGGGALAVPPPRSRGRRRAPRKLDALAVARLAAIACLAAGAGFLLYTAYRIWDPGAHNAQRLMTAKLHQEWTREPAGPPPPITLQAGQPFATIRIPAFGASWQFSIVEGTTLQQLATGPGHVTGTALPGTPGNFAVAAHDITAGNPFLHLGSLRSGDAVIIQDADGTYQYAVTSEKVVHYTDTAVIYPVPGRPAVPPTKQYLTLITCTPVTLDFTPWRIVVSGKLVKSTLK